MDCLLLLPRKKDTLFTADPYIVVLSLITNFFNGLVYMYPNLSTALETTFGLTASQIVVIGVSSHLGIGAMQFPLGLFYRSKWLANKTQIHGLRYGDRLVVFIALIFVFIATLGITLYAKYLPFGENNNINFIFMIIFFILFGAGTGGSYGHIMWLNNHNWLKSEWRRTILSSNSTSWALGAMTSSILYPYTWNYLSLSNIFLIHCIIYVVLAIPGFLFLIRLQIPKSNVSHEILLKNIHDIKESNESDELSQNIHIEQERISTLVVFKSYTAWFLWWSCFFGLGIGGTFIAMINDVVRSVTKLNDIGHKTSIISTAFLTSQTIARLFGVFMVKYVREELLLTFHIIEFIACIVLATVAMTDEWLFFGAIMIGLAFGGISVIFSPIVATNYPGGPMNFGANLGLTIYAPAFGNIIIGSVQTQIYDLHNNAKCISDPYCYNDVFLYFAVSSGCAIILIFGLIYVMKKKSPGF
eukprot:289870_1